jgi:hypothetical protein
MKKGRHRRFEEARALKRMPSDFDEILNGEGDEKSCVECGADPGHDHATWCLVPEQTESAAPDEGDWAS